ncbi:phosphotransferase enzyme family protein [Paenibacillus piscarius]|uniref:phosphotransferase enzyme family protein n=1 Tax=Paenibacillus piscarius TaxID=1089681 RepID=UPI002379FD75|nr:phosphotransferase [Paenibacillus piscarius]
MRWGEAMGKLHLCAQSYKAVYPRPHWQEHTLFRQNLLRADSFLSEKWRGYQRDLKLLSATKEEFGLIHGDLHAHNFLLDNGRLTVIDFGDSEYHWYDYDIAITVYHMAQTIPEGAGRRKAVLAFFEAFMKGYHGVNPRIASVDRINYFIDYRHLFSYTYHSIYSEPGMLNEAQTSYLAQMRQSLEAGGPCLGFNIT